MKLLIGFALAILLQGVIYSQVKDSNTNINSLNKGSWAVQFAVGQNFNLTSFEGAMISLKVHISKRFGVRMGIGADLNLRNSEYDDIKMSSEYFYSGYNHGYNVFVYSSVMVYFNPRDKINLFAGLGPKFTYTYSNSKYVDPYEGEKYYYCYNDFGGGLEGIFGCEWFPVNYLSLAGEYSAELIYGNVTNVEKTNSYYTNGQLRYIRAESEYLRLRSNSVRLGLSLYF